MNKLTWFASGHDKATDALKHLNSLKKNLDETHDAPLIQLIDTYCLELTQKESAVPLILSRFNLEFSQCLVKHGLTLSQENQDIIKHIAKLSYTKFG